LENVRHITPNLEQIYATRPWPRALVNKFAKWSSDLRSNDLFIDELVTNKMTVHFNMLITFMKNWIIGYMDCYSIITRQHHRYYYFKTNFLKKASLPHNYISSQVLWDIARYSTSALDLTTTVCFLLFQVTKLPPRKVQ
jgi:hypothetical protein